MSEEKTFQINDTYRAIEAVMGNLRAWESPRCNEEARANILRHLKEAQFWALELVNDTPTPELITEWIPINLPQGHPLKERDLP
jgi:hypothetical protein